MASSTSNFDQRLKMEADDDKSTSATSTNVPPPCKLAYVSDSEGGCNDSDDSSESEPDLLFMSSDSDSDDLQPPGGGGESGDVGTKWRECGNKVGLSTQKNISFKPCFTGINYDRIPPNSTPLECVQQLLTEAMVEEMVALINKRVQNVNGNDNNDGDSDNSDDEEGGGILPWEVVTLGEMYKYLLVLVCMSIDAKPGLNFDYIWGKNYTFSSEWFNKIMPMERFFKIDRLIRKVFNFSDVDPKATVRGMVRMVMKNSRSAFFPGNRLLVEELVVGTPNSGWRCLDFDTPNPNNYKVKTLGLIDNETSYILNLFLCYGPSNRCYNPEKLEDDFTTKILDQLLSPCCSGHHLHLRKDYSSLPVLQHLEQKFYYIGHVDEKNHKGIPLQVKKKEKLKLGEMKWYMDEDDKNLMAKYRDTKYKLTSALISNHAEVKTQISQGMTMPEMFRDYNLGIKGGEGVHDQMKRYGHFDIPEKRWEKKFFAWLLEIIQLNAFVLYKKSQPDDGCKPASFYKFKRILANELCCFTGKVYNEAPEAKAIAGCLCYRYAIPDMPKNNDGDLD